MKLIIRLTLVCVSLMVLSLISAGQSVAKVTLKDATVIWLFDEGTGNSVKDLSGNGNDGKLNGDVKWADGKFGKGLELGTDKSVSSSSANGAGKVTLSECLWIKFKGFATENQFGYIKSTGTTSPRYLYFSTWSASGVPHNSIHLGTIKADGGWGRAIATGKMFDPDKWYSVCGVVDTKEGVIKAYIDGQLKHTQNIDKGDIPGTPAEIWIGGTPEKYQWIDGTIDEVAIFNVALTEDDIKAISGGVTKALGIAGGVAVEPSGKLSTTWATIKAGH